VKVHLKRIGWNIEGNSLIPVDAGMTELFFPSRTRHGAYIKIREMVQYSSTYIYDYYA
jgi:hypothetical protein